jgi:hypothetical protein
VQAFSCGCTLALFLSNGDHVLTAAAEIHRF